jgi:hypothetical protein
MYTLKIHELLKPFFKVEQDYIENNLPPSMNNGQKLPYPPWKQILTSVPVWALNLTGIGSAFGFYMVQTEIPTYLSTIQHFSLTSVKIILNI